MEKVGLVLEGGGIRGAFTAGAMAWLIDNGIEFDYNVGISSGAMYMVCYLMKDKKLLKNISCKHTIADDVVGIKALMHEGYYVAYKKLFHDVLIEQEHFSVKPLRDANTNLEIGCYDLDLGKTVYFNAQDLDDEMELLRATCSLPVAAATVDFKGRHLLDGGITKMIPIERAVEQGCTKTLVVTTKPKDYVRPEASWFVKLLMRIVYRKYPCVLEDYKVRHLNYYKQIQMINELVEQKKSVMIYPTKTVKVSRWKGDSQKCEELYNLGYQDMEARKEEIFALFEKPLSNLKIEQKEAVAA